MHRTKDGKAVEAGGRVRFLYEDEESMSLIIKGVTAEDAGKYIVVAKNELGQDSTEMDLLVKGKLIVNCCLGLVIEENIWTYEKEKETGK